MTLTTSALAELLALRSRLEQAWCEETSASGTYDARRPSAGQCAVSALVVADRFGGELLRTTCGGESHYYNRLPDGSIVDLTRDQFPVWAPGEVVVRERSYLEGNAKTMARYRLLLERLERT